MKLATTLIFLLLPLTLVRAESSFLFIGNSQTNAFGMTTLFANLAESGGHDVHVDNATAGGSSLSYHTHHQPTLDKLHGRPWDHVVLQEHTLVPVIPYYRDNFMYPAVATLDSMITDLEAQTVLFAHWARPFPDGVFCIGEHCSREFEDYFDMQQEMSAAYHPVAAELDIPLIPVGDVWASVLHDDPSLPLFGSDDMHCSYEGAYFTACIFYQFFFEESPVGLDFIGDLDPELALLYQGLASVVTGAGEAAPSQAVRRLTNHPNPFNPATEIRFELLQPTAVQLDIVDLAGRRVRRIYSRTYLEAGVQRVMWDGRDDAGGVVSDGVYLLNLEAGEERLSSKLTLLK